MDSLEDDESQRPLDPIIHESDESQMEDTEPTIKMEDQSSELSKKIHVL